MTTALLQFAHRSWPAAVTASASITPVTAGRLSDEPLYRVTSDGAPYALRGWKQHRRDQAQAAVRFVRHQRGRNLIVPANISSSEGGPLVSFETHLWELSPWLEGESDFEQYPSCERVRAMCESLAALHLQAATFDVSRQATPSDPRTTQLAQLAQQLDAGELHVNVEQLDLPANVLRELRLGVNLVQQQVSRLSIDSTTPQWIWGDAGYQNFLFSHHRVVGIVDFATVRIDTPLADLARLLGSSAMDHPDWWQAGFDSYTRVRPVSSGDRERTRHLADVGTVVSLGNWLRWLGVERRSFANPDAARERLHHFHRRLAELLARRGPV